MKVKLLMVLACFFLSVGLALAQTSTVTGIVLSEEDGEPVIGASVLVQGTTIGTITDMDGKFTIPDVPASGKNLMVSYVGMKTELVAITSGSIRIVLKSDSQALDEVVVTAQGLTRKEKSIGYSTQEVSAEDLTVTRQTDLGNAMAGKIAGARFFGRSGATFDAGKIKGNSPHRCSSTKPFEGVRVIMILFSSSAIRSREMILMRSLFRSSASKVSSSI